MRKSMDDRKANTKERTIELRIRFHTDGLSTKGKGWIRPKHAWPVGKVQIIRNESHGSFLQRPHLLTLSWNYLG